MKKSIVSLVGLFCCCIALAQEASNAKVKISELENKPLAKSKVLLFKATSLTTNFTVPLLRFTPLNAAGRSQFNKNGNVAFFNSIGAGISLSGGTLRLVTDENSKIIDREMINTLGVQLGFLFSANTTSGESQAIFSPTLGISVLNFQIGYGYELGNRGEHERRGFFTLAYGVPVSKLVRGGFYVLKRTPDPISENASGFLD